MAKQDNPAKNATAHAHIRYPFWFGGSASCFAACVTHPLDLGKLTCFAQSLPRVHADRLLQSRYIQPVPRNCSAAQLNAKSSSFELF